MGNRYATLRNCTTPFEVSNYDRVSDRKSLDARANDEIATFAERLDTELEKYAGKVGCAASGYTSLTCARHLASCGTSMVCNSGSKSMSFSTASHEPCHHHVI